MITSELIKYTVCSRQFMKLPVSTRLLYYYLLASSNDNGEVYDFKQVIIDTGSCYMDLLKLIESGYIDKILSSDNKSSYIKIKY